MLDGGRAGLAYLEAAEAEGWGVWAASAHWTWHCLLQEVKALITQEIVESPLGKFSSLGSSGRSDTTDQSSDGRPPGGVGAFRDVSTANSLPVTCYLEPTFRQLRVHLLSAHVDSDLFGGRYSAYWLVRCGLYEARTEVQWTSEHMTIDEAFVIPIAQRIGDQPLPNVCLA